MEVYSVEEVADKLGVTKNFVYKLLKDEELEGKKVARKWRVTENQLRRYLEG